MVSALGVLVMPKRAEVPSKASAFADDDFSGWGTDAERKDVANAMEYDTTRREAQLVEYVTQLDKQKDQGPRVTRVDLDGVSEVLSCAAASQPVTFGPSLSQLALDPRRREECPVCSAEWSRALERLGFTDETSSPRERSHSPDAAKALSVGLGSYRRRSMQGKGVARTLHSTKCTWAWYQQSMMSKLASQRFDLDTAAARSTPANPNSVLPPPMMDVYQSWRQRGGRERAETDRSLTTDRLVKGEPTS